MEQTVTTARARRGQALISVTAFLVLSMLLWTAAYQQGACHLRVEKALQVRPERSDQLRRATAWSLTLLETGHPPLIFGVFYRCRMVVDGDVYLTTYLKTDPNEYLITVDLKDPSYGSYPLAPNSFGTE